MFVFLSLHVNLNTLFFLSFSTSYINPFIHSHSDLIFVCVFLFSSFLQAFLLSQHALVFLFFLTSQSIFIILPPHSHPSSLSSAPSFLFLLNTLCRLSPWFPISSSHFLFIPSLHSSLQPLMLQLFPPFSIFLLVSHISSLCSDQFTHLLLQHNTSFVFILLFKPSLSSLQSFSIFYFSLFFLANICFISSSSISQSWFFPPLFFWFFFSGVCDCFRCSFASSSSPLCCDSLLSLQQQQFCLMIQQCMQWIDAYDQIITDQTFPMQLLNSLSITTIF